MIMWPPGLPPQSPLDVFGGRGLRRLVHWSTRAAPLQLDQEMLMKLEDDLATRFGRLHEGNLVLYVGEATPYQKMTAALLGNSGEPVLFVKIALTEQAQRRIAWERHILGALAGTAMADRAPALSGTIEGPFGEALVLRPVPGRGAPRRLGELHRAWVNDQLKVTANAASSGSGVFAGIRTRSPSVVRQLGPAGPAYKELEDEITMGLAEAELPLSLAHGDFTPWNTRVHAGRLRAFDWEAGILEAPPLYDLFYHSMTSSIGHTPTVGSWDRRVQQVCRSWWPELRPRYELLKKSFLVYAVDAFAPVTALDPFPGPIWRWLSRQLELSRGQ